MEKQRNNFEVAEVNGKRIIREIIERMKESGMFAHWKELLNNSKALNLDYIKFEEEDIDLSLKNGIIERIATYQVQRGSDRVIEYFGFIKYPNIVLVDIDGKFVITNRYLNGKDVIAGDNGISRKNIFFVAQGQTEEQKNRGKKLREFYTLKVGESKNCFKHIYDAPGDKNIELHHPAGVRFLNTFNFAHLICMKKHHQIHNYGGKKDISNCELIDNPFETICLFKVEEIPELLGGLL